MRIAGPVWLSILLAACGKVEPPKYTITMPERQTRLPNGMRVFLLPDATTDLVEVDVRASSTRRCRCWSSRGSGRRSRPR